jgi:hypothetical protein
VAHGAVRQLSWQDRMDALRRKRQAAGRPSHSAIAGVLREREPGEDYRPNRWYDYAADIAQYPQRWRPTEPIRVSMSVSPVCSCGAPVRTLRPTVTARPRLCTACLDDVEPAKLPRNDGGPVRVAALYLPGLADALDAPEKAKPTRSTRPVGTVGLRRRIVERKSAGESYATPRRPAST